MTFQTVRKLDLLLDVDSCLKNYLFKSQKLGCIDGPLKIELATDLISHKKLASTAATSNGTASNGKDNGAAEA